MTLEWSSIEKLTKLKKFLGKELKVYSFEEGLNYMKTHRKH